MKKVVIILPTYNERDNIQKIINKILKQQSLTRIFKLNILVVDDNSPDGTAKIVNRLMLENNSISLLSGKKAGLGIAYKRGFSYAINSLKADIVCEMDADLSHNPKDLIRLLNKLNENADIVIGSRYVKGGKLPKEWPLIRRIISKLGNFSARNISGVTGVNDCTGGFRAISVKMLKKINFRDIEGKGYVFQVSLLRELINYNARVIEVPIVFKERKKGYSKISLKDIKESLGYALKTKIASLIKLNSYHLSASEKKIPLERSTL